MKAVGYDYPPDYAIRTMTFSPGTPVTRHDCTTHDVFFPAGITVIEYLTNLDAIGVARCRFIALPLAIDGADGSPVRAIALVADSKIGRSKGASAAPSEPQNRVAPASRRSNGSYSDALLAGSAQPGYGVEIAAADSASARAALAFHMALAWSILARASA